MFKDIKPVNIFPEGNSHTVFLKNVSSSSITHGEFSGKAYMSDGTVETVTSNYHAPCDSGEKVKVRFDTYKAKLIKINKYTSNLYSESGSESVSESVEVVLEKKFLGWKIIKWSAQTGEP